MREWLKGILGTVTPPPEGVTPEWVSELKSMLAEAHVIGGTNLSGSNLDSAVEFVLRAEAGTWVHPVPRPNTTVYTSYRGDRRPEQPGFYAALGSIPGNILLRWAQVLEAMAYPSQHRRLYIPFPGSVHWPELVLVYGSGSSLNSWPPNTQQRIACSTIEKMLVAAGMEPHALLVGAFATRVDSGYGAEHTLAAVSYCPDYAEALDRHIEMVRPLLLAGSAAQRVHILTMLTRATPPVLDKLAPEIAQLAISSAKQVRIAADSFVQSAGPVMAPVLRQLATEGKPEQRLYALRHLYQRGQKGPDAELCDFARATATADKASSVQALIAEWEANAAAESAPESKYQFEVPSIAWGQEPDAGVSARLDKLWQGMNRLIRADNQRAHEQYERYKSQHGQPTWSARHHNELTSDWLKDLKALLGSGSAPPKDGPHPAQGSWVAWPAIRSLAGESVLRPTELFKVLHHVGYLFGHDGRLNHVAGDCFNQLYASTGRPTLIELATMIRDTGLDPALLLNAYCSGRFGSIARGWRREDVWPFVAQHVPTIERYLQGLEHTDYFFERSRLYEAIAMLPTPPPRIVNALFAVALGQAKSERKQAQEAVANLPDKEARIIAALSDGKSEIRAIAAQWLCRLRFNPALGALEKAVAAERHDNAKGAMLDALEVLGEPVDKYLKRDLLLPEAKKALAKGLPQELGWVPWDSLPQVRWADTGSPVAPEVLKWMIAQACRANSPEPNAVLRKYCAMFEPRDREGFGQWVLDQWLVEDIAPITADEAQKRALAQAQSMHSSMKSHPQYHQNNPHLGKTVEELTAAYLPAFLRQPRGSAVGSKGMLAAAAACAGERAAAPVARFIKEWYGTRASQGKALVAMLFAGHRIEFDARGPSQATCSCPAHRACQHVLAAAITLASLSADSSDSVTISPTPSVAEDPLEPLRTALLEMAPCELRKHAGKVGYRWAWQFVQDLDIEKDVVLSGERNFAIAFRHPPASFRYMGGPVEALLSDADIKQPEKYRVAAVLAFQRAHGKPLERPDDPVAKTASLDLGKDHALAEQTSSALLDSRLRLLAAVRQLAGECVKLGLAHFSPGIHERFETLAVWAQGAQCYRLALLLRRIADHVEMLLARAGGADEQRLFDELAFANALVSALESAAARGKTPAALIGRARNEYEEVGRLELLGLGASAWRSASGYLGLTMLFWSPTQQSFYSCTDARPEVQRGFDPVARYKTPGPWSGFGAPAMATGRRIVLTGALTSAAGRVSASERTTATVMPPDPGAFVAQLPTHSRWNEVARERAARRRSLLAEAQPLKDWVILRPRSFRRAQFDAARQTMRWGLVDDQDEVLSAELSYDKYTAAAIERLEHVDAQEGVLVVARLRGGSSNFVAEPLSLIRLAASADSSPVASLYFDAAPKQGLAGRLLSRLSRRSAASDEAGTPAVPPLLSDSRHWLRLLAERGLSADVTTGVRDELKGRLTRLAAAGFSAFGNCISADTAADVLRAQYLCMQYEHLLDDSGEQVA